MLDHSGILIYFVTGISMPFKFYRLIMTRTLRDPLLKSVRRFQLASVNVAQI